ncbi:MAG: hypothetical protein ACYC1C_06810 [Chloroflexota bacterium]
MRQFAAFLLTFAVVYLLTPWVTYQFLNWTAPGHYAGAGLLAVWGVYAALRHYFGERLPNV